MPPEQPAIINKKRVRLILVALIVLIIGLVGFEIYQNSHFRITKTDPGTNNVATISPFLKIYFNRQLDSSRISFNSDASFIHSYDVAGNVITIYLNIPLSTSQTYGVSLNAVYDNKGELIQNREILFKPKLIATSSLPADQRAYLLSHQAAQPPSVGNVGFVGIDSLMNYGLTSSQSDALERAFFNFDNSAKKVIVDASSISLAPHDPTSTSMSQTATFNVTIDQKEYSANITYTGISQLELVLDNTQTGAQVYDSGTLTN